MIANISKLNSMINIFVGYDKLEPVLYHVCSNSIIRRSSEPVSITPLSTGTLSNYNVSRRDGSNDFVYSRFLVPELMNYTGWAIFIDGDMIVNDDITKLYDLRDESKAVQVIKHDYKTKSNVKYLGNVNEDYPRKNWSSVILWNCAHPANRSLSWDLVERQTGRYLHRFCWLNDDLIGELPKEWNWLADEYGSNDNAKLIHYTLGAPCFLEYANTEMSELWHSEFLHTTYVKQ